MGGEGVKGDWLARMLLDIAEDSYNKVHILWAFVWVGWIVSEKGAEKDIKISFFH